MLCGGVLVGPLLLLQLGSAHAPRVAAASPRVVPHGAPRGTSGGHEVLPSQLVRFEAGGGTDPTGAAPAAGAPAAGAPVTSTSAPTTTTSSAPSVPSATGGTQTGTETGTQTGTQTESALVPSVTTTTTAPAPALASTADSEKGDATWYAAAAPGRCASPTLPFGTVLTVTNVATGAQTVCTVDDREQAGYPRVVDLSPSGFAQLEGLGRGVVDVTVSW